MTNPLSALRQVIRKYFDMDMYMYLTLHNQRTKEVKTIGTF